MAEEVVKKNKLQTEWAYLRAKPSAEQAQASTDAILKMRLGVKKASKFQLSEAGKAWIALIPSLVFLLLFMIYPIINTFLMSFISNFSFMGGSGTSFAITNYIIGIQKHRNMFWGFDNYAAVLTDPDFIGTWNSIGFAQTMSNGTVGALMNTLVIVVITVPLTIIIGLLIAVCLHNIKPLQGFYQTVFFLPYVTNSIALGMVFKIIFADDASLFNMIIGWFGAPAQAWLTTSANKWMTLVVITIYSIWNGIAFKILVFMSGLSSIDNQYYDAAKIDGASRRTIFRRITVPLLSPQILYITVTSFIGAFKSYTSIISLYGNGATFFGGTQGKNWETVVGYIYVIQSDTTKQGRAAAASLILLVIILLITLVQMAVSKKKVVY
jgi:multiple sugar transport system permease protein